MNSDFRSERAGTDAGSSLVFVIDDDASVRRAIGRLLNSVGLGTALLESANEFLSADRPETNSCIILDVRLPGMSGLRLQSELNYRGDKIPVVFITAYGDIRMTVRALQQGAVEFLPKPSAIRSCSMPCIPRSKKTGSGGDTRRI